MTKEKFNELKKELEEELNIIISEDDFESMSLDSIKDYILDNNMLNEETFYNIIEKYQD